MDNWLRRIVDLADGFKQSMVILTAAELDLFSVLGAAKLSEAQVARRIKAQARATGLWLNALAALGVIEKKDGRYANTPQGRRFLERASPEYRGSFLRHIVRYWPQWAALTDVVRAGEPAARRGRGGTAAEFAWAMHDLSMERAKEVAAVLWPQAGRAPRLEEPGLTALDLGGGPGTYAVAMAKRNPRLKVTVLDRPEILEVTRQLAKREGLTDRITFLPGDFMTDALCASPARATRRAGNDVGCGYDLILVSSVIHSYGEAEVRAIVRKCAAALRPGGRLAVHDFLLDETMTRPVDAALFSVHMLVVSSGGRSYSTGEVSAWMRATGLSNVKHVPVGDGTSSLLIATRPRRSRPCQREAI